MTRRRIHKAKDGAEEDDAEGAGDTGIDRRGRPPRPMAQPMGPSTKVGGPSTDSTRLQKGTTIIEIDRRADLAVRTFQGRPGVKAASMAGDDTWAW